MEDRKKNIRHLILISLFWPVYLIIYMVILFLVIEPYMSANNLQNQLMFGIEMLILYIIVGIVGYLVYIKFLNRRFIRERVSG